jgi:hypothetical protein
MKKPQSNKYAKQLTDLKDFEIELWRLMKDYDFPEEIREQLKAGFEEELEEAYNQLNA